MIAFCNKHGFLRLRSDLVPKHVARERFLMGTNVNTPFFQVPTPEFGHGGRARVQGRDLVLGHWTGQWYIGYPVSEHSTILCRCPGTSAWAPSVNTAAYLVSSTLHSFSCSRHAYIPGFYCILQCLPNIHICCLSLCKILLQTHRELLSVNPLHRRTSTFGLEGGGDLIAGKKYTMPESMCCTNALKSQ